MGKLIILWFDNFGENQTPLQRNDMAAIPKIWSFSFVITSINVHFFMVCLIGDPNSGRVWYSIGKSVSDRQMVRILNDYKKNLSTGFGFLDIA